MSLALEAERLNQLNERQQQQQQSRDEKMAQSAMGEPYFVEARSSKAAEEKVQWCFCSSPFFGYLHHFISTQITPYDSSLLPSFVCVCKYVGNNSCGGDTSFLERC